MTTLSKSQVLKLIKSHSSKGFLDRNPSEIEKNVREIINFLIPQGIQEVKGLAKYLKGKTDTETAFNIHAFCRKFVQPTPDPIGKELISYPYQTLKRGKGDCEDCSGLIGSLLSACNIDSDLRVADCEDGYMHIYNVVPTLNLVVDGTLKVCGAEIKRKKYKDYPVNKGLGKLPVEYWSERERFVVTLWEEINGIDKVTVTKIKKNAGVKVLARDLRGNVTKSQPIFVDVYKNSLPLSVNRDQLAQFITDKFPNTKVNNPYGNFEIEVILNNGQIFKVGYENLADLIYKIQGSEGLKVKAKVVNSPNLSKIALSPENSNLMKMLMPFTAKDDLRPAMNGIHFLKFENGIGEIEVTDGQRLIILYDSEENPILNQGLYSENGSKIDERFPDTTGVIKDLYKPITLLKIQLDKLIPPIKQALKFANKTTKSIYFNLNQTSNLGTEDSDYENDAVFPLPSNFEGEPLRVEINGKLLLELLMLVKKEGSIKSVTLEFRGRFKPITFEFISQYGKVLCLIMPLNNYEFYGFRNKLMDLDLSL